MMGVLGEPFFCKILKLLISIHFGKLNKKLGFHPLVLFNAVRLYLNLLSGGILSYTKNSLGLALTAVKAIINLCILHHILSA